MGRRKKGKGSIYRRNNGTWRGQFWLGDERKSVTGNTKKEVVERIKILEIEASNKLNKGKKGNIEINGNMIISEYSDNTNTV